MPWELRPTSHPGPSEFEVVERYSVEGACPFRAEWGPGHYPRRPHIKHNPPPSLPRACPQDPPITFSPGFFLGTARCGSMILSPWSGLGNYTR